MKTAVVIKKSRDRKGHIRQEKRFLASKLPQRFTSLMHKLSQQKDLGPDFSRLRCPLAALLLRTLFTLPEPLWYALLHRDPAC